MKKALFTTLFALFSLLEGPQAFAFECPGPGFKTLKIDANGQAHCTKAEKEASDRGQANWHSGNNVTVMPIQRIPVHVIHQPVHSQQPVLIQQQVHSQQPRVIQSMPSGYGGYRNCTEEESIRRAALITTARGLAGLLIYDNGRAAGQEAGFGLLYAMGTDCRVAVPQGTARILVQQGVQVIPQPATVHVPSNCSIDGNPKLQNLRGLTEAQCAALK